MTHSLLCRTRDLCLRGFVTIREYLLSDLDSFDVQFAVGTFRRRRDATLHHPLSKQKHEIEGA